MGWPITNGGGSFTRGNDAVESDSRSHSEGDALATPESTRLVSVVLCMPESSSAVGLRALIDAEPDIVLAGRVADCGRLVELVARTRPRIALLDLGVIGSSAIDVIRQLVEDENGPTDVLSLVDDTRHDLMFDTIRAGARAVARREGPVADIIAAIRALGAGTGYVAAGLSRHLLDHLARSNPPLRHGAHAGELTDRELEVLELMASGMSNSEIAAFLSVTERTVKYHVSNILDTLGVRDRLQAVSLVYRTGPIGRSSVLEYRFKTGL